jgi:thiamine-phosphate pyrophosphorylase
VSASPRSLPPVLVLTDRAQAAPRPLLDVIRGAVAGGATALVLREKDLPARDRSALVADIRREVAGLQVLLAASALAADVDGVHLAAGEAMPAVRPALVGRSCHDDAEVARASAEGCDYVTVSPVFASPSKPGYGPPLGLAGLAHLASITDLPVYALGGVTAGSAAACLAAGAHGIATMGAVMRADDPAAVVAALVEQTTAAARRTPRR